jgi:putative SOS response-associated peptidase YedK
MSDQFPPARSAREGVYPVSKKVNSVKNDEPSLIEPAA